MRIRKARLIKQWLSTSLPNISRGTTFLHQGFTKWCYKLFEMFPTLIRCFRSKNKKDISKDWRNVANKKHCILIKDLISSKFLNTSNNQRLEKCVRCVLLLYNWDLRAFFFFWLTTFDRHGHDLVLLKFTIKELNSSCLFGIGSIPAWDRGQVRQSDQDGGDSQKTWPGIRDQYLREILEPAGLKNDFNSMRSV